MPNLADPKIAKELTEDELEQISGGVAVNFPSGSYSISCPCGEHTYTFTKTGPWSQDSGYVFHTCPICHSNMFIESSSYAKIYKSDGTYLGTVSISHTNA